MSTTPIAHLIEYFRLGLTQDEDQTINRWAGQFLRAREAGLLSRCRQLLQGAKSSGLVLSPRSRAVVVHCQALLAAMLDQPDEAEAGYRRSLTLFRQAGDEIGIGWVLNDLGTLHYTRGKWPQAVDCYREALAQLFPARQGMTDEAMIRNNLGLALIGLGQYEAGVTELEQAGDLYQQLGTLQFAARVKVNLGQLYHRQGNIDRALKDGIDRWRVFFDQTRTAWQLDQAQKLLRLTKRASFSNRDLALVRYSEGLLYAQLGEWDRSIKCFMHGVDLLEDSEYVEEGIWILNDLGMVLRLQGNHQGAEAAHRQALSLAEEIDQPHLIVEVLEHLGLDLEHRENVVEAIDYFRQALAQRETLGDEGELLHILNHLGRAFWLQGDLSAAQDTFQRALTILRATDSPNLYLAAQIQANLGNIFYEQDNLFEAEDCWQAALDIFNTLGVVYDKIGLLNNLGGLAFNRGDYATAKSYYQHSLALARDLGDWRGIVEALTNLGVTLTQTHDWPAAADYYHQALQIEAGDRHQARLWQSQARVYTLMAIDWLRKANLGEVTWPLAIKQFLNKMSLAITCLFQVMWRRAISLWRSIVKLSST